MADKFSELQLQIEQAKKEGRSPAPYVRQQIEMLQEAHDNFLKNALAQGYGLNTLQVATTRKQYYAAMIQLAEEIGDSTQEYEDRLKEMRLGIFGEANYKRFYGD